MTPSPVTLREIEKADLPALNAWRNDKKLLDLLGNNFLFISSAVDEKWFEDYLQNRDKSLRLAITLQETGEYIGNVNLTFINAINRSAEFSIMIGNEAHWSKGLGTCATKMMLDHGFNDRGLNRIYLTVIKENVRAYKSYLRAGFKEEGIERQNIFKNGKFHDSIRMSILRSEFVREK